MPRSGQDREAGSSSSAATDRQRTRRAWRINRRCCFAQKPACGACPVAALCPAYGEGPTNPTIATTLIKT